MFILFFSLETVIFTLKLINRLWQNINTLLAEIIIKLICFLILAYMFIMFVRLVNFFRKKKEEKLTRLQRYVKSCQHSTIVFGCYIIATLNIVEYLLSLVYPIVKIKYNQPDQFNDALTYEIIYGFILR